MSESFKEQLEFIQQNYNILEKINNHKLTEIDYILTLAGDNFLFSAPEVVNYCYIVIYESLKLHNENSHTADEILSHISQYLQK